MTNGVTNMYIYCDEVKDSIVGNTKSQLLVSVPLQKVTRENGGELCTYTLPPDIIRTFIKSKFTNLHISLYDTANNRIQFSAGTVNIEAVIE